MYEKLRYNYIPQKVKVRVLFIGEAPPANGNFFYKGDSTLLGCTKEAFAKVYKRKFSDYMDFLKFFQSIDCFLEDLCDDPIDRDPVYFQCQKRLESIPKLAKKIDELKPKSIIVFIKRIKEYVDEAVKQTNFSDSDVYIPNALPFPRGDYKRIYIKELERTLNILIDKGILEKI